MVEFVPDGAEDFRWLSGRLENCSERSLVFALLAIALAIRVYLSLTSFCISGDGAAYLGMARQFSAGHPAAAMNSVFSPLYPWLISWVHYVIPDWETAGELVSTLFGTVTIVTTYGIMREVFERRDLAFGAGALAAIHPQLTAYSASVRTEAGFIFLMTASVLLLIHGLKRERSALVLAAGVVGGVGYLYRTEAIGLLIVAAGFMPIGALLWRRWSFRWGLWAAALFSLGFLALAAPYLIFLRVSTGHWSVGREFAAAMMYGMSEVAPNRAAWRRLGFSAEAAPLAAVMAHPWLYCQKVAADFIASFYGFLQALGPVLTVLMLVGLWAHGRKLFGNFAESFLALLIAFYFCGFALSYTGTRFMVHFIAFTFGWVMLGLEAVARVLNRTVTVGGWRLPEGALAIVIALTLLPRTLWPIGYDLRGLRYAAEDIARRGDKPQAIVARDGRVAYYAGAKQIALPERPLPNLCEWLAAHEHADYLMIGNRDERKFGIDRGAACLEFVKRYPRYGSGYYDLFAIRHSN
ncbi:MAG: glycosyltransferase family 39 protein [Candidatus Binataceae bacterium]